MDSAPYNTTLQLFLCLLAVVVIACCVIKNLPPKCKDSEGRSNVHLYYLVGIGSLLIIELVTYTLTGTGEVSQVILNQISFASTISSILLSVIAIIYSIVSGSKGANLYVKTEEVSKEIEKTLPKFEALDAAVEELKGIPSCIEKDLGKMKGQMLHLEDLLSKTLQGVDSVASTIPRLPRSFADVLREEYIPINQSLEKGVASQDVDKKSCITQGEQKVLRRYVYVNSPLGIVFLLACCYAYETKKSIVLKDELFGGGGEFVVGYLHGYLVASQAIGLVSVTENEDGSWGVDSLYDGFPLKEEVLEVIKKINGSSGLSDDVKRRMKEAQQEVEKFFTSSGEETTDV